MTITHTHDTPSAAELEDILVASPVQQALYIALTDIERRLDELESQKSRMRDELRKSMADTGAQAITQDSKVIARISDVITSRIDAKRLRKDHPKLAADYMLTTKSTRFTVTLPKDD